MLWIARSLGRLSEPITMKAPISVHHNARKQMFYGSRTSEAWFPTYSLLSTKENAQSVHLEHQYRMSHVWTVTAWFAGNFQVSYGSSGIHSVSVFANPRRLWLCSTNNRLQTCPEIKIFGAYVSGRNRPFCWSTSFYPSLQKHVAQELPNCRKKMRGAPTCMNHKWIPISRSKSCTKENRMDLRWLTIPGIFQRFEPSLFRYAKSCIEAQGGHV